MKKIIKKLAVGLLITAFICVAAGAAVNIYGTDKITGYGRELISGIKNIFVSSGENDDSLSDTPQTPQNSMQSNKDKEQEVTVSLIPGGQSFGVKFYADGVMVVGVSDVTGQDGKTSSPAYDAGIRVKDIIKTVDGRSISSNEELISIVRASEGQALKIEAERDGEGFTATVTPVSDEKGEYKIGLTVRDSTAGIGTITYYDPVNHTFAALGHGINDTDTQQLLPLRRGEVLGADIFGIVKGQIGSPGELQGTFRENSDIGILYENSAEGIFGELNEGFVYPAQPIPTAEKSEVREGPATIMCTIDDSGVQEFEIEIVNIINTQKTTKNMLIKVTDPDLLAATGGIVQGMSGSPIIQNGKLIGAVTHVLVNDPTEGYAIFIENMMAH